MMNQQDFDSDIIGGLDLYRHDHSGGKMGQDLNSIYLPLAGGTMSGDICLGDNDIASVGTLWATMVIASNIGGSLVFAGDLDMAGYNIVNVGSLIASEVTCATLEATSVAGCTFLGNVDLNGYNINNAGSITATEVIANTVTAASIGGCGFTGDVDLGGYNINNVGSITATEAILSTLTAASIGGCAFTGDIDLGGYNIDNIGSLTATEVICNTLTAASVNGCAFLGDIDLGGYNIDSVGSLTCTSLDVATVSGFHFDGALHCASQNIATCGTIVAHRIRILGMAWFGTGIASDLDMQGNDIWDVATLEAQAIFRDGDISIYASGGVTSRTVEFNNPAVGFRCNVETDGYFWGKNGMRCSEDQSMVLDGATAQTYFEYVSGDNSVYGSVEQARAITLTSDGDMRGGRHIAVTAGNYLALNANAAYRLVADTSNLYISLYANNNEVARFKSSGSLLLHKTLVENAF